jgi:hypothetical protein
MEYEALSTDVYFNMVIKNIQQRLQLQHSEIEELITLRHENEKEFLKKIAAYYYQIALSEKCRYYGFKIFDWQIKSTEINIHGRKYKIANKLSLQDVINYADKIIILNRDNYDVAYSCANSFLTNEWDTCFRDNKVESIEIDEQKAASIINLLKTKRSLFSEAISESIIQNKDVLCLEYSEFTSIAWSKISNFLDIKVIKQNPLFSKNDYGSKRDAFFAKYPAIAEAAKRYNFSLDDLREENISRY